MKKSKINTSNQIYYEFELKAIEEKTEKLTKLYEQVLETLGEDYIRTARAKGVKERTVLFKHTMRAVFAPIITLAGLDFAGLIGGAIITETIFNLPGLGRLTLRSTFEFDLPVVLATTILAAAVVIIMNLIIDMLYAVLDPRVRI